MRLVLILFILRVAIILCGPYIFPRGFMREPQKTKNAIRCDEQV